MIVIVYTWLIGWWSSRRWVRAYGVNEPASIWTISCVLPSAALILAIHLPAYASLLTNYDGLVRLPTITGLFALLILLLHCFVPREPKTRANVDSSVLSAGRSWVSSLGVWWLPILVVAGMYLAFAVDALTRYPTGYDAVTYHLPMALNWAREGNLDLLVGHSGYSWPANGALFALLIACVKAEPLFSVMHLPGTCLLGAVMFALAQCIGVSRRGAVLTACIALSVPMVVFQGFSGYVDVFVACAWLVALLTVLWSTRVPSRRGRHGLLAIGGLAVGVAVGGKITFVALFVMLGMVVWWMHCLQPRKSGRKSDGWGVAVFALATLVCSAFWFVRGGVQAGNPVYPLTVEWSDGGMIPAIGVSTEENVFPERTWSARLGHWWNYPWRETKRGAGYSYGVDNGLGAAFATFVPLGFVWTLVVALRRRKRADGGARTDAVQAEWQRVFIFFSLAGCVMLLTVFHETIRFALPLFLVAIPVAAISVDRLIARYPRSTAALLTLSLTTTAAVATLPPVHSLLGRLRDGDFHRSWFYQIPPLVDEFKPGSRVLNLSTEPMNYPLYGSSLSNVVIAPLHWRALSGGGEVSAATLMKHDIDYVYVQTPWPTGWDDDLPIELIHDDTDTRALLTTPASRIYRVTHPRVASIR